MSACSRANTSRPTTSSIKTSDASLIGCPRSPLRVRDSLRSDERRIHDEQSVTVHIVLDGSFHELTECATVPANLQTRIALLVFQCSVYQRTISARMVPGESGENGVHVLPRKVSGYPAAKKGAARPAGYARNTSRPRRADSEPHKPPSHFRNPSAWNPLLYL